MRNDRNILHRPHECNRGRGFSPIAEAQLGKDVCDVMLDGLAAYVEALGNLRIRQPLAE
jgi:hypothetical protein